MTLAERGIERAYTPPECIRVVIREAALTLWELPQNGVVTL